MSTIDDGGPAFPTDGFQKTHEGFAQRQGMSLRDNIAIHALPIVAPYYQQYGHTVMLPAQFEACALAAYQFADAMLKARRPSPAPEARADG